MSAKMKMEVTSEDWERTSPEEGMFVLFYNGDSDWRGKFPDTKRRISKSQGPVEGQMPVIVLLGVYSSGAAPLCGLRIPCAPPQELKCGTVPSVGWQEGAIPAVWQMEHWQKNCLQIYLKLTKVTGGGGWEGSKHYSLLVFPSLTNTCTLLNALLHSSLLGLILLLIGAGVSERVGRNCEMNHKVYSQKKIHKVQLKHWHSHLVNRPWSLLAFYCLCIFFTLSYFCNCWKLKTTRFPQTETVNFEENENLMCRLLHVNRFFNFCRTSSANSCILGGVVYLFVCLCERVHSMFHLISTIYFELSPFFPLTHCHLSPPLSASTQKFFDRFKMEKYSSSNHLCFPPQLNGLKSVHIANALVSNYS